MPQIRILPDILASQVAAWEVVERPASAVKEMVEIRRGGAVLVRVSDDGCGMSSEDAQHPLERHATSKLVDSNGLQDIQTRGFRGEAVPRIASVSQHRLASCEMDAVSGTEIVIEGWVVKEVKDAGSGPGTMTEERELFFNLPARRKFLRAETTARNFDFERRVHGAG